MKTPCRIRGLALAAATLLFSPSAFSQAFTSGSTGSDGALDVTANTVLPKRPSGVFNYTTIRVRANRTLTFERNDANTPIHLLATGNVLIEGIVNVSGEIGGTLNGGLGGPGGFDGGRPGIAGAAPGAGYGPGGGKGGLANDVLNGAGGGAHATAGSAGISTNKGVPYGTELLLPLLGGSGGGGQPDLGGCGGGGAILIASSTRIEIPTGGQIIANGGQNGWGYGSGGAIRLVAPEVAGAGILSVQGHSYGGDGRIRVDLVSRRDFGLRFFPGTPDTLAVGSLLTVFPPVAPQLDVIRVGSQQITPGTQTPVFVRLPVGAPESQAIEVQARDFNQSLLITVALIPDSGPPSFYKNVTVDNVAANPARQTVPVSIPANVLVRVMAWTQ